MCHPGSAVLSRRAACGPFLGAALLLIAVVAATCSKDVGEGIIGRPVRALPTSATEAAIGLDLGFRPVQPLRELALAGASLPRAGAVDLTIAFLAFTSSAPADDGDGQGTPLDRTTPPPTDTNGADDVFLAAIVNTERTLGGQSVPTAFTQGIAPIMRDPRCTRCHSFHYPDGWRVNGHIGSLPAGTNAGCDVCHKSEDVLVAGLSPSSIIWLAPDVDQTRNPTQDFRGKTDRELFDLATSPADPRGHLQTDDKILWAIAHGRVPFRGASFGGPVPIDPQQWHNLIEAWAQAGMPFSTDAAVDDVVLASRRATVNTAGNGASSQPSLAFVANPGYTPADPTANALGTVHVAFASSATNLIAAATTTRNIFRTSFEVWLLGSGEVDLRLLSGQSTLLSASTTGGPGGNADSAAPVLDADGNLCAFESAATNLVAGFAPDPTAARSNVYLRNFGTSFSTLVSHQDGTITGSGNGDSRAPSISATGGVVAFESDASDLVPGDGNGARDVFVARTGGTPVVQRASIRTGGVEVTGGASTGATVFRDPDTDDVWVAFQSTADFGTGGATPAVLLHRPVNGITLPVGDGSAGMRQPAFTPDGSRLTLVSAAAIDTARPDRNGLDDLIALEFRTFRQNGAQHFARSSLAVTGGDGDGPVADPVVGGFRQLDGTFLTDELLAFTTTATNLGRSPNSDIVVDFAIDRTIPRVVAEFSSQVTRGAIPFTMQFNDLSNNAVAWSWDFGDGDTSTEQSPSHTYTVAGTYTVSLEVSGTVGSTSTTKMGFAQATADARTWSDIYGSYTLASSCSGGSCHNPGTGGGLSLPASAATARNNLVNRATTGAGCAPLRVAPGNPAGSSLVQRISSPPACGSRMGSLSPQAVQDIIDWITRGANP